VNGETTRDAPFTPFQTPRPEDAYGVSKREAEEGLWQLAQETGMEVVVVRPPLVYGPGAKGNWRALESMVRRGVPLPLGGIRNHRSFVALENLVDLIVTCLRHPAAAGQTFLVSDGEDVSIPVLLHKVAAAWRRPARLIPLPQGVLRALLSLMGRRSAIDKLCASLQVDISHTRHTLGWEPVVSMDAQLAKMADGHAADSALQP
jgi:nucleoside-diphosphate-sugar epimerase